MAGIKKYLLLFAQDFVEFRYPEIESLIKLFKINVEVPKPTPIERPYWILENVEESEVRQIASRSVSLKFVAEIWSSGTSYDEFHGNVKKLMPLIDKKYKNESFKFMVETYNKHIKLKQRIEKIETMNYLDSVLGTIDLKNPDNTFVYFEYYGIDDLNVPVHPEHIYFGRYIADGQRDLFNKISLKTRKFIGNTSMDPQLSILMANQGLCSQNDLMFDPFCGTGSMLIAGALFGSYVIGMDIDYLTLHAKTKPSRALQKVRAADESIRANMEQYNLQNLYLDVFVGDFANYPLKGNLKFDSIICDPPYGVREGLLKVEKKEGRKFTAMTEDAVHYPSLSDYKMTNLFHDLLNFSVKHLKIDGRLVCWFPIPDKFYDDTIFPQHSALKLISTSRQQLIGDTSRILLTYEKIAETGELVKNDALENVDFRMKYFTQYDKERKETRHKNHQKNLEEAEKRGIKLMNKTEWKKYVNKKRQAEAMDKDS
ncbi:unnamed protein product [Chironomus riparius]|uniref:tRNA (guanine(10)-N(2))-methyltransferase TRMT11 n=1 Tax=Chironomus riparius TaxID=315576 RepID=A0A9N9S0K7_9DIPT|nr:unnamed protein product [Chironomus riparius]